MKILIVRPGGGLCNQLQCIIKGILLANKYNRNIYITHFQTNVYNINDTEQIDNIFDIPLFNTCLKTLDLNVIILADLPAEINTSIQKIQGINYDAISSNQYINDIMDNDCNINCQYLDVGNILNLDIYKSFNIIHQNKDNIFFQLFYNIPFHRTIMTTYVDIKEQLQLPINYTCIHLRLEDDAINYFSKYFLIDKENLNEKLKHSYTEHINNEKDNSIFICTGLLLFNNSNNNFYQELKRQNSNIIDKQQIIISPFFQNRRELLAILDFLIAKDANKFIGWNWSSFSLIISYIHNYKRINTSLICI